MNLHLCSRIEPVGPRPGSLFVVNLVNTLGHSQSMWSQLTAEKYKARKY
jgi:hypothetical protein